MLSLTNLAVNLCQNNN